MKKCVFKKGQEVTIAVSIGGITTYEEGKILKVDKKGVYLDCGKGNDPQGPYDPKTGEHITIREVGMLGSQVIKPKK